MQFLLLYYVVQPIVALKGTERFVKVPLRGTFTNLSGFYNSAKRCILPVEQISLLRSHSDTIPPSKFEGMVQTLKIFPIK